MTSGAEIEERGAPELINHLDERTPFLYEMLSDAAKYSREVTAGHDEVKGSSGEDVWFLRLAIARLDAILSPVLVARMEAMEPAVVRQLGAGICEHGWVEKPGSHADCVDYFRRLFVEAGIENDFLAEGPHH